MSTKEEYRKSHMTNEERQCVMNLDMLTRSFAVAVEGLRKRLTDNGYRWINRDLGMMKSTTVRLLETALDGMEPDMAQHLLRQSRDFTLECKRISPLRKDEEVVMPLADEWQFVQIALDARCAMCIKTAGEAANCPVRKLLHRYAEEPETTFKGCGYQCGQMSQNKRLNEMEEI